MANHYSTIRDVFEKCKVHLIVWHAHPDSHYNPFKVPVLHNPFRIRIAGWVPHFEPKALIYAFF